MTPADIDTHSIQATSSYSSRQDTVHDIQASAEQPRANCVFWLWSNIFSMLLAIKDGVSGPLLLYNLTAYIDKENSASILLHSAIHRTWRQKQQINPFRRQVFIWFRWLKEKEMGKDAVIHKQNHRGHRWLAHYKWGIPFKQLPKIPRK